MKVYFKVFINGEQNKWTRLEPIAKFAYNNIKSVSIVHIIFKFYCAYNLKILFKDEANSYLRSCSTNELAEKPKGLIKICY